MILWATPLNIARDRANTHEIIQSSQHGVLSMTSKLKNIKMPVHWSELVCIIWDFNFRFWNWCQLPLNKTATHLQVMVKVPVCHPEYHWICLACIKTLNGHLTALTLIIQCKGRINNCHWRNMNLNTKWKENYLPDGHSTML